MFLGRSLRALNTIKLRRYFLIDFEFSLHAVQSYHITLKSKDKEIIHLFLPSHSQSNRSGAWQFEPCLSDFCVHSTCSLPISRGASSESGDICSSSSSLLDWLSESSSFSLSITQFSMDTIITVVAELLIHMERNQVGIIKPTDSIDAIKR